MKVFACALLLLAATWLVDAKEKDVKELKIETTVSAINGAQCYGASLCRQLPFWLSPVMSCIHSYMQHKPEECSVKAKAGDKVHVHYTVSLDQMLGSV